MGNDVPQQQQPNISLTMPQAPQAPPSIDAATIGWQIGQLQGNMTALNGSMSDVRRIQDSAFQLIKEMNTSVSKLSGDHQVLEQRVLSLEKDGVTDSAVLEELKKGSWKIAGAAMAMGAMGGGLLEVAGFLFKHAG